MTCHRCAASWCSAARRARSRIGQRWCPQGIRNEWRREEEIIHAPDRLCEVEQPHSPRLGKDKTPGRRLAVLTLAGAIFALRAKSCSVPSRERITGRSGAAHSGIYLQGPRWRGRLVSCRNQPWPFHFCLFLVAPDRRRTMESLPKVWPRRGPMHQDRKPPVLGTARNTPFQHRRPQVGIFCAAGLPSGNARWTLPNRRRAGKAGTIWLASLPPRVW